MTTQINDMDVDLYHNVIKELHKQLTLLRGLKDVLEGLQYHTGTGGLVVAENWSGRVESTKIGILIHAATGGLVHSTLSFVVVEN
jgi:hypothetical protein